MIVSSTSFENMGMIPKKHTGFGEDVSPEFTIGDIPDNTVSFAVVLDDLDVPFTKAYTHWIIWNIPKTEKIPGNLPKGETIDTPVSAVQGMAWGKNIYRGPKQPFFIRKEHRYVFYVYALDCMLDIPAKSDKNKLMDAIDGHILGTAELTGRYKPE